MDGWMIGSMDWWLDEWIDGLMIEWMDDGSIDGWIIRWLDELMDDWLDDGWMDIKPGDVHKLFQDVFCSFTSAALVNLRFES